MRGLDSANVLEFVKTLRLGAESSGCTSFVAIYQCSQNAYDVCPAPSPFHSQLVDGLRIDFRQGYPSLRRSADLLRSLFSCQRILHFKRMVLFPPTNYIRLPHVPHELRRMTTPPRLGILRPKDPRRICLIVEGESREDGFDAEDRGV